MKRNEFPGCIPFDRWNLVPPSLASVLPNVMWNRDRLHRLVLPVIEFPIADLRWQLDLPWWGVDHRHFAVSPNQVRSEPGNHATQWRRVLEAELRFPIHLLERDRLILLDGVHRLLKADVLGMSHVSACVVSHCLFVEQIVERELARGHQGQHGCER